MSEDEILKKFGQQLYALMNQQKAVVGAQAMSSFEAAVQPLINTMLTMAKKDKNLISDTVKPISPSETQKQKPPNRAARRKQARKAKKSKA